jgi:hypothetical protein
MPSYPLLNKRTLRSSLGRVTWSLRGPWVGSPCIANVISKGVMKSIDLKKCEVQTIYNVWWRYTKWGSEVIETTYSNTPPVERT